MTSIKERPILFNGEMVRAILEGRKTVTRHAVKGDGLEWLEGFIPKFVADPGNGLCPYGIPGDRLWVRETFACGLCTPSTMAYRATHKPSDLDEGWNEPIKWTPSIHMPRGACRILLEITAVRIERLQNITPEQCKAEGIVQRFPNINDQFTPRILRGAFLELWNSVGGDWAANPWVWVVEFKRAIPTSF